MCAFLCGVFVFVCRCKYMSVCVCLGVFVCDCGCVGVSDIGFAGAIMLIGRGGELQRHSRVCAYLFICTVVCLCVCVCVCVIV